MLELQVKLMVLQLRFVVLELQAEPVVLEVLVEMVELLVLVQLVVLGVWRDGDLSFQLQEGGAGMGGLSPHFQEEGKTRAWDQDLGVFREDVIKEVFISIT